jgi:hypothetical protein
MSDSFPVPNRFDEKLNIESLSDQDIMKVIEYITRTVEISQINLYEEPIGRRILTICRLFTNLPFEHDPRNPLFRPFVSGYTNEVIISKALQQLELAGYYLIWVEEVERPKNKHKFNHLDLYIRLKTENTLRLLGKWLIFQSESKVSEITEIEDLSTTEIKHALGIGVAAYFFLTKQNQVNKTHLITRSDSVRALQISELFELFCIQFNHSSIIDRINSYFPELLNSGMLDIWKNASFPLEDESWPIGEIPALDFVNDFHKYLFAIMTYYRNFENSSFKQLLKEHRLRFTVPEILTIADVQTMFMTLHIEFLNVGISIEGIEQFYNQTMQERAKLNKKFNP